VLPDGPYGNFAGRDASRGMAMQSFEEGKLESFGTQCLSAKARFRDVDLLGQTPGFAGESFEK
jgi:hypothetical protein